MAAGAAALLAVCLAVAVPGTIERYGGPQGSSDHRAGAWARGCFQHEPREDRALLSRCSRVEGRVLYVKREPGEIHLAVVARLHLFVVKLRRAEEVPRLGSMIAVVGPLVRARNGLREVQAFAVDGT